jgi:hypothetical protein
MGYNYLCPPSLNSDLPGSLSRFTFIVIREPVTRLARNHFMSGYTKFAVVGAGYIGGYIIQQLLKDKATGIVKEVVVLTRQV